MTTETPNPATASLSAFTQLSAADSDETAALGREELALADITIPESAPLSSPAAPAARSVGHISFDPATEREYYISLRGVYRAAWGDSVAHGYRPAQFVCSVNDALFDRESADSLPKGVVAAIRKSSGL